MSFIRSVKVVLFVLVLFCCIISCSGQGEGVKTGGWQEIDFDTASLEELEDLNQTAIFAIQQINVQLLLEEMSQDPMPIGNLSLSDIIEAQVQVVAGLLYNITIITTDDNSTDFQYNALVYSAPWLTPPMTLDALYYIFS